MLRQLLVDTGLTRVCISIVTKGWIRAEAADWRDRAFVQLYPNVELQTVISSHPLQAARCLQIDQFLASACTSIFLLDSDCIPREGTIQRLLAHDLPFVAAPHPTVMKNGQTALCVQLRGPDGYIPVPPPIQGMKGPDAVVGCAGMLIRREVFEQIGRPWFRTLYDEVGGLLQTEDFELCDRAYKAGIEVWADCDLYQKHMVTRLI